MLDGSFLHWLYLGPDGLFPHLLMGDPQKVAKDLSLIPPCFVSVFLRTPGVNLGSSSAKTFTVYIIVHNSGQDRMTFFVSQAQPGLGRCYLRTASVVSNDTEMDLAPC